MRTTLNDLLEAAIAFVVIAFMFGLWAIAALWVTLLPSIGALWLIGWLS